MWRYISGTLMKPRNIDESYAALIDVWEATMQRLLFGLTILLSIS
jgi:hypothetical protein